MQVMLIAEMPKKKVQLRGTNAAENAKKNYMMREIGGRQSLLFLFFFFFENKK